MGGLATITNALFHANMLGNMNLWWAKEVVKLMSRWVLDQRKTGTSHALTLSISRCHNITAHALLMHTSISLFLVSSVVEAERSFYGCTHPNWGVAKEVFTSISYIFGFMILCLFCHWSMVLDKNSWFVDLDLMYLYYAWPNAIFWSIILRHTYKIIKDFLMK
jgi:hypothetical protein